MKRSFTKIIAVVLAMMFALTAMACVASAETTVVKCNCCLNNAGSASDTITKFQGDRDIYLVLDISGSMSGDPIKQLKVAAKEFCKRMLEDTTGDNRIAIVTYNTNVQTFSFSNNYSTLAATIDAFTSKGSTAMYDALMAVKEIDAKYGKESASKHVVVMADGLPNEGAVLTSGIYTSKDSTMYYKHGNAVYSTAAGMWPDYLVYSIGFFHNLGGSQLRFGQTLMKDIQNALYLEVFDPDKLVEAFTGVADNIIGGDCDNGCDPSCDCSTCDCGGDCQCSEDCECYDRHNAPETTTAAPETTTAAPTTAAPTTAAPTTAAPTTAPSIPQTGDSSEIIVAAAVAVIALSGVAAFATKKRED